MRVTIVVLMYITTTSALSTYMFKYLKDLCPRGLLPLTGMKHCDDDLCPSDAQCIQGICCVRQPLCLDLTYSQPTPFSCLPKVKQNCPSGSRCVPSNRVGMNICCSTRQNSLSQKKKKARIEQPDRGVCPASHPVVRHENNQLLPCSRCSHGICVPFRNSDVKVCCQSYAELCGTDSSVEMDGLLARDCSYQNCSEGFECSLTSFGSRVCCSYALCPTGQRARGVCAAGCRRDEQCLQIQGQRWCCPIQEEKIQPICPENRRSNGEQCSLSNIFCSDGLDCMQSENDPSAFLCCERTTKRIEPPPLFVFTTPSTTTTTLATTRAIKTTTPRKRARTTTLARFIETTTTSVMPFCANSGLEPLTMDGVYLSCPEIDAPCPKAGFTCQETSSDYLYCCPLEIYQTTQIPRLVIKAKTYSPLPPSTTTVSVPIIRPSPTEGPAPSCGPGHIVARNERNNEIRTCAQWFDFTCPLFYTCLPSASTPGFLCCKKVGLQ